MIAAHMLGVMICDGRISNCARDAADSCADDENPASLAVVGGMHQSAA